MQLDVISLGQALEFFVLKFIQVILTCSKVENHWLGTKLSIKSESVFKNEVNGSIGEIWEILSQVLMPTCSC